MKRWCKVVLVFWGCTALVGCASYPRNPQLAKYEPGAGYRFNNLSSPKNSDSLFVILSFSGGGTRAAALSYGVMEKLRGTKITWEGEERRLLDEVDVISSVSGGSFTAAYYGLFGEGLFEKFEQAFLYKDIQGKLVGSLWSPVNWFRLASPTFGRIDLASELYDREIFDGKTYADLLRQGRPFVLLNATDMSMGAQFTFEQAQFDPLCSDLGGVHVARAVAASSNFPVAFTPLTLNNHAGSCDFKEPEWVGKGIKDAQPNPERYNRARIARSYLDAKERPYLHLLDGGISDNIGLRGPLVALRSNDPQWSLLNKIGNGEIKKLVVITVDAKTSPPFKFDKSSSPPDVKDVLETVATVPMQNYSFDTVELLRKEFEGWDKARRNYAGCEAILHQKCPGQTMPVPPLPPLGLYRVYVGFDQIEDESERRYFQSMATSFHLPRKQVDDLRRIARELLDQSRDFHQLTVDLR
ncbi:MAG TPA: patatin-like phospholipase family protein [Methylococcaceae bacterium]|nr:patatin-like phospholipase family protein [Methylococcaceae bacterium]